MKTKKSSKKLFMAISSFVVSFSLLIGVTLAWFTTGNKGFVGIEQNMGSLEINVKLYEVVFDSQTSAIVENEVDGIEIADMVPGEHDVYKLEVNSPSTNTMVGDLKIYFNQMTEIPVNVEVYDYYDTAEAVENSAVEPYTVFPTTSISATTIYVDNLDYSTYIYRNLAYREIVTGMTSANLNESTVFYISDKIQMNVYHTETSPVSYSESTFTFPSPSSTGYDSNVSGYIRTNYNSTSHALYLTYNSGDATNTVTIAPNTTDTYYFEFYFYPSTDSTDNLYQGLNSMSFSSMMIYCVQHEGEILG